MYIIYTWEIPRNTQKILNGLSHHLKYYLMLKTKERWHGGGWSGENGQLWEVIRKSAVNKSRVVRFKSVPSPPVRVSCDLESFSSWHGEGNTLTNRDFFYKCKFSLKKDNFYSVFRPSPVLALSQK